MEQSELLSEFRKKVDEYVKCLSFIDKAKAQAEKFDPTVIEKVVASHNEKAAAIVDGLIPLSADLEQQISDLQAKKVEIQSGQEEARNALQELELRHVIGELTKKSFESKSKNYKKDLEEVDAKVAELDASCESFQGELDRWTEAAEKAGVLAAVSEPLVEELVEVEMDLDEVEVDGDDGAVEVAEAEDGVHAESVSVVDDLSVVFDEDVSDDDSVELIEAGDEDEIIEAVDSDDEEIDILVDEEDSLELEDAGIEAEEVNGTGRKAVLLYSEGTAEEQVHPVSNEVISLGRGRDNDIQVKNDSKVSRYHCKIYSRGPNYYIEDNKSANGSLVNGELITERRLFGGEEIIIGETFFRFRILD
jgi:hypothetical protein